MTEPEPTYGLLLAGGQSKRMGGGDKPLREVSGRPILARVIDIMAPQCTGLLLNANGDPARFCSFALPVVADDVQGFAGPLAGILAGLDWLANAHREICWAVSIAADTPFIPCDLVERLHAARKNGSADLACAASGGRMHPVIGLWPVSVRSALRTALIDEDVRKIDRFTARYRVAAATWPIDPFDPFFNANQPSDISEAERIAKSAFATG